LVVRTSAFFGPWDSFNFVTQTIARLQASLPVNVLKDAIVSPTYVPDLVHACLDLLVDGESGVCHLANTGQISWADFARKVAELAGLDQELIREQSMTESKFPAPRPRNCALASERFQIMGSLDDALARYLSDRPPLRPAAPNGAHLNGARHPSSETRLTPCATGIMTVIRDVNTGKFYAPEHQWTADPTRAYDFRRVATAQEWVKMVQLSDIEIVRVSPSGGIQPIARRVQERKRHA
jgi:hypothetical protein